MKKIILPALLMLLSLNMMAQPPQKFNYQGVARMSNGSPIASQAIGLKITILDGSPTGTTVYSEKHSTTTNQFGLYNVAIGGGTVLSGSMGTIPWGTGDKYVKVEIDPAGGTSYVDLGTAQLLSVPYAMYSGTGVPGPTGPTGPAGPAGPAGSANISGTTNYLVKFTGTTTGAASGVIETNNKIGIGTTTPSSTVNIESSDSVLIRASSTYSSAANFGIIRAEYTGSTDANHAALAGIAIPNLNGTNGTGTFSVGGFAGVDAIGISSTSSSSAENVGVRGRSQINGGTGYGVLGIAQANGTSGGTKYGIYGTTFNGGTSTSFAGYFDGNVQITGTLAKSSGSFKIDHPLDPENKYLYHSFVESPDMMNVYNGNVTTGANGTAVVTLPDYFEALNKDFRYQLTVIGKFAQAIIAEKVSGNKFTIKTNEPNTEVSWQVTGIRKDAYAAQNPIIPEVEKEPENKGKYLTPAAFNKPASLQIGGLHFDESKEIPVEKMIAKPE